MPTGLHHRSRRRADARAALHEALAYFERDGAEPWAEAGPGGIESDRRDAPGDNAGGLRSLTRKNCKWH